MSPVPLSSALGAEKLLPSFVQALMLLTYPSPQLVSPWPVLSPNL